MGPEDPRSHADGDPPDDLACSRYFSGESDPVEAARVAAWIAADPGRAAAGERLRAIWGPVVDVRTVYDSTGVKRRLMHEIEQGGRPARVQPGVLRWWHDVRRFGTWAVAVGGMAVAAAVVLSSHHTPPSDAYREFTAGAGTRRAVTLPDGTRFTLGPASRLRVPADFGARARSVALEGEAYFSVVHDATHPFTVQTAHTVIRDVGTVFVVRAYAGDENERVAVVEGQVAVRDAHLGAHDAAMIDTAGLVNVRRGVNIDTYVGWMQGQLVFDETPLRDVIRDVGRTYNIDIVLADSTLGRRPVTASFSRESANEVLDIVARVIDAHVERAGRKVIILPGTSAAEQPTRVVTPPPLVTARVNGSK